ncbi:MAG TPA: DUF2793 domain-containing protein [Rhizomicrobium sp.]|nr:DUF2793 domain-containing protein [Rhizomicrobium sp.]
MSDTTPRSGMPLLAAAQAQKHVTHNEALLQLDALGCARVLDRDLSAPPASPADGDAYLIAAAATGDWTGQDGKVAFALDGAWRFYAPFSGLIVYVSDEALFVVFDGAAWRDLVSLLDFQNLPMVGIGTSADGVNRLAVKSEAVLFDNDGAGAQVKLDKAASGDTASLLYQTAYSGRAEIGLCGDDDFHFKVSPDGSSWSDAIVVDGVSGGVSLAQSLSLPAGSAASPSLAFAHGGWFDDGVAPGLSIGGAQQYLFRSTGLTIKVTGGGFAGNVLEGEGLTSTSQSAFCDTSGNNRFSFAAAKGSIAAPATVTTNFELMRLLAGGYGATQFQYGARLSAFCIDPAPSDSAMGCRWAFYAAPVGGTSPSEVLRLEYGTGLSMYGANTVIDANRCVQLRSTTVAGAVAPSAAGKIAFHSDAQSGKGEVVVDDGSAYRHAGQAAVRRLAADADATYTPRLDGRIVRDVAALTANRKLVLSTSNVTDGHKLELSRRGSSGGHSRQVYQADGTTLIASLVDNASADFIYDAAAGAWFQK